MLTSEIKAMLGCAAGVMTARVHMAIAAFGRAVPAIALVDQNKFAGLLHHFSVINWLVLDGKASTQSNRLCRQVELFVFEFPELRELTRAMLPKVRTAWESRFVEIP